MFLIVGAPNSSNSRRLVEVAERNGAANAALVRSREEVDFAELEVRTGDAQGALSIGLSAGASAPEILIQEIVETMRDRFDLTVRLAETVKEDEEFLVMRDLRDVPLTAEDMAFVNGAPEAIGT